METRDQQGRGGRLPRPDAHSRLALCLSALAAAALAACARPPHPSSDPLAEPVRTRADVVDTLLEGGWIRVTAVIPRSPPSPRPVVLAPIVPDDALLRRGIAVAHYHTNWELLRALRPASPSPTPARPSPEVGAWLLAAPRPGIVGRAYFEIITEEAERSIPRVVDFLTGLPAIDPARISIGGSSTSGFRALQAMAADSRISVGVVRAACGDYHLFLRSSNLALNDDPRWIGPGGELPLDPDYEAEVAAIEPIRRAERYPPRPLLLVTGSVDPAIPPPCSRRTATVLARAYARAGAADRFRFVELEGRGHNLGPESERLALEWWERWLLDADRRRGHDAESAAPDQEASGATEKATVRLPHVGGERIEAGDAARERGREEVAEDQMIGAEDDERHVGRRPGALGGRDQGLTPSLEHRPEPARGQRLEELAVVEHLALEQLREVRRLPEPIEQGIEELVPDRAVGGGAASEELEHGAQAAFENGFVERLFPREVIVDAALIDTHPAGDLSDRDGREPALREELLGHGEDTGGRRGARLCFGRRRHERAHAIEAAFSSGPLRGASAAALPARVGHVLSRRTACR